MINTNTLFRHLLLIAATALLTACATIPKTPVHIPPAPTDLAVVYVFRPAADKTGSFHTPDFLVNGQLIARLKRESYTVLRLAPGRHKFALQTPNSTGSIWNTHADIEVNAGNNYFVAIWNQGQITNRGTTVPLMLPGKGPIIPITLGVTSAPDKVTFEVVPADIGSDALRGLQLIPADTSIRP